MPTKINKFKLSYFTSYFLPNNISRVIAENSFYKIAVAPYIKKLSSKYLRYCCVIRIYIVEIF